jgi:nucleotide-binding universal stress UspA family protein
VILLCYDGSDDAKDAAENAAKLFPATPATVLAVWEPYIDVPTQDGFGLTYLPAVTDVEEIAAGVEQHARATAQEGADRLKQAGIAAQPRTEVRGTSVAATILDIANEIDADAIVLGTHGRGGLKSLLLGSVSHAVVQHTDRPVVVIPSAAVAQARGHDRASTTRNADP